MGKLLILSLEESEYSLYNKIMEIVNTTGITTYSLTSLKALNDVPVERLKEIIADHSVNGAVDLPKEYGMFIAKGVVN